ncbi:50S ribosomal protein L32 [Candidatus Hepatobacter penaei]|uniref:50S ribosomal protein L32 n=1 Tax=Candidatus Hepatobacter penaei TaxID=1274402 RepID=UPI0009E26F19|nr:50S ribosomal protein L32 [bacterium NHP-B]
MAVPKKRTSLSRKKMRAAGSALRVACVSKCANCGSTKRAHHMCDSCGHYKGRLVLAPSPEVEPAP